MSLRATLLPGAVLPAALAYEELLAELGPDVEAVAKDLELYAADEPPSDYSLELEGSGILREADARGWERFHLVGYSGGGAAAVAFAGSHADRLSSLALLEPAWAGNWSQSPAELAFWEELRSLEALPDDRFLGAFVRLELAPGVEPPPPPAEPPPFLANRPSGIRHLTRALRSCDLERDALERFARPPSTSRSAPAATLRTTGRSPPGSRASSATSSSRSSRSVTTSTRRTASSRRAWRVRSGRSGRARDPTPLNPEAAA